MMMLVSRRSVKSVCQSVCCMCRRVFSSTETIQDDSGNFIEMVKEKRRMLKNSAAVVDYLVDNVIYKDSKIIAINKPMELPLFYHPPKSYTGEAIPLKHQPPNLEALLPSLGWQFKARHLNVSLPLQRQYSGVLVLGTNQENCKEFKHKSEGIRRHRHLFQKMDMICLGIPKFLPDKPEDVFLKYEKINNIPQSVQVIKPPMMQRRTLKTVEFLCCYPEIVAHYSVGKSVYDSWSHVRLHVISSTMDVCQNYMAWKLAPVLGDPVYHKHVAYTVGAATRANPHVQAQKPMPVFPEMKKRLGLKPDQESLIPLMVHKSSVHVPKYHSKPIVAPLPDYFQLALEKLSLIPDKSDESADIIEQLEKDWVD